jgi:pyrroloquinoline quinone biosynthesis protein D
MRPDPYQRPRLAKSARLQTDRVSGNPVLLNQEAVLVLNQTGYQVLRLCDGTQTVSEIIGTLAKQYQIPVSALSEEVSQYIKAISLKGLIEWA